MPLTAMAEAILQPVIEGVAQWVCFGTAWLIVPIITIGRVYVEPTPIRECVKRGLGRLQRSSKGHYIMEAALASLVGTVFWFVTAAVAYASFKQAWKTSMSNHHRAVCGQPGCCVSSEQSGDPS